ncbi:MAG: hypothetical protein ABMA64_15765 [Myxococcota bacterium]
MLEDKRVGSFVGVVVPSLLSGLGPLLVLRGGQVVGDVGPGGALALWTGALALAGCTAAALAAVASTARIDARTAISSVRGSLGRGVGVTVGVPLWLARAFAAAVGALAVPAIASTLTPSALMIALLVVSAGGVAAWQVAPLLLRAAPIALALVGIGVVAMVAGGPSAPGGPACRVGVSGHRRACAVPLGSAVWAAPDPVAATGEVRRTAPRWWGLAGAVLVQVAVLMWLSRAGSPGSLMTDERVGLDAAGVPALARLGVAAGALFLVVASIADGARVLREIGSDALPWLERSGSTEFVTAGFAFAVIGLFGASLDGAATGLALSLLLAGGLACSVVAIELALGLTSFRPSVQLPLWVPAVGAVGSFAAMLAVGPLAALVLGAVTASLGSWFVRGPARTEREHSAILTATAEWLNRRSTTRLAIRAWKPSLLVPLAQVDELWPALDLLTDLAAPEGAVALAGTGEPDRSADLERAVGLLRARGLHASATWLSVDRRAAVPLALETLRLAAFRPNLLVLRLPQLPDDDPTLAAAAAAARRTQVGVVLIGTPADAPVIGGKRTVTLWVRGVPGVWDPMVGYEGRNLDLTLLLGHRLARRWGAELRLVTVVTEPEHRPGAEQYLASLCTLARLPSSTVRLGIVGSFEQAVDDLSNSDFDVFGLQPEPDFELARRLVARARSTCLFVLDSGRESALV